MLKRKFNPQWGHYKVGNQIMYSKPEAILWASKSKQAVKCDFKTREL